MRKGGLVVCLLALGGLVSIKAVSLSPITVKVVQEKDTLRNDGYKPGGTAHPAYPGGDANFVAAKLTPSEPCRVEKICWLLIFNEAGGYGVRFGIWDDFNGMPGPQGVRHRQTMVDIPQAGPNMITIDLKEIGKTYYDEDDFWVGCGISPGFFTVGCDRMLDHSNRVAVSIDGIHWQSISGTGWGVGDPVIWAIVAYGVGPAIEEDSKVSKPVIIFEPSQPNPFSLGTVIGYQLSVISRVSLRVYDVYGKLVRTLVDAKEEAGCHTIHWDGKDSEGKRLAPGIYFCRLTAGKHTQVQKLIIAE